MWVRFIIKYLYWQLALNEIHMFSLWYIYLFLWFDFFMFFVSSVHSVLILHSVRFLVLPVTIINIVNYLLLYFLFPSLTTVTYKPIGVHACVCSTFFPHILSLCVCVCMNRKRKKKCCTIYDICFFYYRNHWNYTNSRITTYKWT